MTQHSDCRPIGHSILTIFTFFGVLLSSSALAQDEILTASKNREMGGSPLKITSGPPDDGKEVFFSKGIQGEPRIEFVVGADGALSEAFVVESSRSAELDEFALSLVKNSTFEPAKDKSGQPVAVRASVPIRLWKDSIADGSIFEKRCDDFLLDAAWFIQAFPEKKPNQMRSWLLLTGALVAARFTNDTAIRKAPDFQAVYNGCKKEPSGKFVDVYAKFES